MLEWCFYNESPKGGVGALAKSTATRGTGKPRRITVKIATAASERVIGRAVMLTSYSTFNVALTLTLTLTLNSSPSLSRARPSIW